MKLVFAGFSLGLAFGLSACANVITVDNSQPAGEDDSQTTVTEPGNEPNVTDPGEKPASQTATCTFGSKGNAKQNVLAMAHGRDVVMIRGDGTSFVAFTFAEELNELSVWMQLATKDGFVAATAAIYDEANYYSQTVLLSVQGEVVWKSAVAKGASSDQNLGPAGTLAYSFNDNESTVTNVVWADGTTEQVPGVAPLGAPSAEGRFPAALTKLSYMPEFRWAQPGSELKPLAYLPFYAGYPVASDGSLFYIAQPSETSSALAFIAESSKGITVVPLQGDYLGVGMVAGDFVMIRDQWEWNSPHQVVNSQNGELKEVTAPTDVYAFGMAYYNGISVDDQGAVWLPGRSKSSGGLFRSVDNGKTWKRMGKSVSNVWDAGVVSKGGTFVVVSTDTMGYFPMDEWEKPSNGEQAAEVNGPNVEVLRPENGIAHTLNPESNTFVLNKTGQCLAYQLGNQIQVLDVKSGEETTVGEFDYANSYSPAVWLE